MGHVPARVEGGRALPGRVNPLPSPNGFTSQVPRIVLQCRVMSGPPGVNLSLSLSLSTWDGMCSRHERLEKRHARYLPPTVSGSRAGTDLPTNVQAVSRAVSDVNTHRPRFQVRT